MASNQKVGSSNLSGRATYPFRLFHLRDELVFSFSAADADHGLPISTYYIKDAGEFLWQKTSTRLIYHQRAQSNDFWLMAPTWTSFLTKRGEPMPS
ncbi:MAG: hypothetical protein DMG40_27365 [Acidobacteria bacterium]|nr:MAG: hypothetical protein DMG40_27365 [Acidobacteriota bacterium]